MSPSRRQVLAGGVALTGLLAGCRTTDPTTPTPTPPDAPGGTETRTTEPTPEPSGPTRQTRRQTGEGPLAVADGANAYVALDGRLEARALGDGTEQWTVTPGAVAGLCLDDDGLFAVTEGGELSLHAPDGTERWRRDVDARARSLALAEEGPVVLGTDGAVLGVGRGGNERWRASVSGTPVGLDVGGDSYVVTESPARLVAFDADGERRWTVERGRTATAGPTRLDDVVLYGAEYPEYEPAERSRTPTPNPTDAAISGGVLAVEPDGELRWEASVPGTPAWFVSTAEGPLAGVRGFLFEFLEKTPQVAGWSADGRDRWRLEQVPFARPAAVTQGVALAVDPAAPEIRVDGEETPRGQTALRTDGGGVVWASESGVSTAAAAGESFVTVTDGTVGAVRALSGRRRWRRG